MLIVLFRLTKVNMTVDPYEISLYCQYIAIVLPVCCQFVSIVLPVY